MSSAAITLSGLVASNFIFQAIQLSPSWTVAIERSFFQIVAVALVLAAQRWSA